MGWRRTKGFIKTRVSEGLALENEKTGKGMTGYGLNGALGFVNAKK